MNAIRLIPLVVSALLLGAHFYRNGNLLLALGVAASPLILLVRREWAVTALQVALFVGAAEWVRTALSIASIRAATGAPSTRMFVILGSVALFTALSAWPLRGLRIKN
ncbi:MAG: hypothetical protein WA208_03115 [Thermoanaerobaculia bacterium]